MIDDNIEEKKDTSLLSNYQENKHQYDQQLYYMVKGEYQEDFLLGLFAE